MEKIVFCLCALLLSVGAVQADEFRIGDLRFAYDHPAGYVSGEDPVAAPLTREMEGVLPAFMKLGGVLYEWESLYGLGAGNGQPALIILITYQEPSSLFQGAAFFEIYQKNMAALLDDGQGLAALYDQLKGLYADSDRVMSEFQVDSMAMVRSLPGEFSFCGLNDLPGLGGGNALFTMSTVKLLGGLQISIEQTAIVGPGDDLERVAAAKLAQMEEMNLRLVP